MTILYKLLGIVAVVVIVAAIAIWGVRQYGNNRVAEQELSTVKDAVQGAVAERKEAAEADASTAAQKRSTVDSVRLLGNSARADLRKDRDAVQDAVIAKCAECAVRDANAVFVLNNLIRESNRVIDGSR